VKTIEISTAKKPLSDYAKEIDEDIIVLTSDDKPVAAIVSLKNVDPESLSLSTNPEFLEIIERAREEFKSGKKLSLEEMQQEVSKFD
jgi:PHD/YefM family antitoxin component YafN of YafNO toxin-antitoxin module